MSANKARLWAILLELAIFIKRRYTFLDVQMKNNTEIFQYKMIIIIIERMGVN